MGEKYKVMAKAFQSDTFTFQECISICVLIALILFVVYFITWYIGSKQ